MMPRFLTRLVAVSLSWSLLQVPECLGAVITFTAPPMRQPLLPVSFQAVVPPLKSSIRSLMVRFSGSISSLGGKELSLGGGFQSAVGHPFMSQERVQRAVQFFNTLSYGEKPMKMPADDIRQMGEFMESILSDPTNERWAILQERLGPEIASCIREIPRFLQTPEGIVNIGGRSYEWEIQVIPGNQPFQYSHPDAEEEAFYFWSFTKVEEAVPGKQAGRITMYVRDPKGYVLDPRKLNGVLHEVMEFPMLSRSTIPKEYHDWIAFMAEGVLGGDIRTARFSRELVVQPSRVLEELTLNIPRQAVRLMNLSRVYLTSTILPHVAYYLDQLVWQMYYTALPFFDPDMAKDDPGLRIHLDQMESPHKASFSDVQHVLDRMDQEIFDTIRVRSTGDSAIDILPKKIAKLAAKERLIKYFPNGHFAWYGPLRLLEILPHTSLMSMEPTIFFKNEAYLIVGKYKFKVWVVGKTVKFLSLANPGDTVRTFDLLDWYRVGRSQGHYKDENLYDIPSEAFAIRVFEAGPGVYGLSIDAKIPLLAQWIQPEGRRYSAEDFHYSGLPNEDAAMPDFDLTPVQINTPQPSPLANPQRPFERAVQQEDGSLAPGVFEARNALLWLRTIKNQGWNGTWISSDDGSTSEQVAIEDAIFAASKGMVGGWIDGQMKRMYWLNDHRVRRVGGQDDLTGSLNPIIPFRGTVFLWFGMDVVQVWVNAGHLMIQEMNVVNGVPSSFPIEEAAKIRHEFTTAVLQVFPVDRGYYGLSVKPSADQSILVEWEMPNSDGEREGQNASATGMWAYAAFLGMGSITNMVLHIIPDLFAWISLGSTVVVIVLAFIFPDGTIAWTREGKTEIDAEYDHLPSLIRRWIDVEEASHRWSTRQRVLALLNRPWKWEGAITLVALPLKLIEEALAKSVALAAFTLSSVWSVQRFATRRASSVPLETAA